MICIPCVLPSKPINICFDALTPSGSNGEFVSYSYAEGGMDNVVLNVLTEYSDGIKTRLNYVYPFQEEDDITNTYFDGTAH